jgi:hypothetical protein
VEASAGSYYRIVHITVRLHRILKGIQEVVAQQMALVRSTAREAMDQYDRVIILPELSGYMAILTIHNLVNLDLVIK